MRKKLSLLILLSHLAVLLYGQVFYYQSPTINSTHFVSGCTINYLHPQSQNLYVVTAAINQGPSFDATNFKHYDYGIVRYDADGNLRKECLWSLWNNPLDTFYQPQWMGTIQDSLWVAGHACVDTSNYLFLASMDTNLNFHTVHFYNLANFVYSRFVIGNVLTQQGAVQIFYNESKDSIPGSSFSIRHSFRLNLNAQKQIVSRDSLYSPWMHASQRKFGLCSYSYFDSLLGKQKIFFRPKYDSTYHTPNLIEVRPYVINVDTSTWHCDMNNATTFWYSTPSFSTKEQYEASSYKKVLINQFNGFLTYKPTSYLIGGGIAGMPRYAAVQSITHLNAVYEVDRVSDTMLREVLLPWYKPEDSTIASQLGRNSTLRRDSKGNIYWVSMELCLQKGRGVLNVFCLDSNLNLKWSKFLPDTLASYGVSYALIDSNDRVLISYSSRRFDGTGSSLNIIRLDSSGAIFNATKDKLEVEEFVVYPNPANEKLGIQCPAKYTKLSVELYTLDGKRVLAQPLGIERTLAIGNLPSGAYLLRLKSDGKVIYGQVLNKR